MRNKNIFVLAFFALWLGSCQDLLDVNSDPSRIGADEATLQTLLPSAERFSATTMYGASQYGAQYPQYLTGQAISQYTPYGFDQLWQPFYADALPTLQEIIKRGEAVGAFNYSGIAKTLLAVNLMTIADVFGHAPYSNANQGTDNLYPCYDSQEDLYQTHILDLLNGAIADFDKPLPELQSLKAVQNDYIYAGNIEKWKKATHAVLARYYLNLSNVDPAALAKAVTEAGVAIGSNADDLQLVYEDQVANPWYGFLGNATNKIMQPGGYLVDLLSGRGAFDAVVDPRLPRYFTKSGASPEFVGLKAGRLTGADATVNTSVTGTNFLMSATAPIQLITYAEVQFILAEGLFETNKTESYAAYLRGISASVDKAGVAVADRDNYLANPEIAMGEDNLTLSDIMLQKYIALYLQMETWTDMRRYQYDHTVYEGLVKPEVNQIPGEPWVQRSNLADEEPGVNTCLPEVPNQGITLWLFE
jgi:hypothetical protein